MVEDVEKFRPETESKSFADMEHLVGGKIKVHQVGAAQYGTSGIPELVRKILAGGKRRSDKRSLIEPAIQGLMARTATAERCLSGDAERKVVRIVNYVGTRGESPS